jgi:hypothetical protein
MPNAPPMQITAAFLAAPPNLKMAKSKRAVIVIAKVIISQSAYGRE